MQALLLWTFSLALCVQGQVPLSDFYPYGTDSTGDYKMPRSNDLSVAIGIPFQIPFFNSTYRTIYLSTNGLLTFESQDSEYVPKPFPRLGSPSVASYWTNSDPSRRGDIFCRPSELPSLLDSLTQDIRSQFANQSYTSRFAFVVTFDKVAAHGCDDWSAACAVRCSDTHTFQTILTSDGTQSFAIFLFNSLNYTVGTSDCDAHAQVGINAGDGKIFYSLPWSNTPNIFRVALASSNVCVPGKWIFPIDGSDVMGDCASSAYKTPPTTSTSTPTKWAMMAIVLAAGVLRHLIQVRM